MNSSSAETPAPSACIMRNQIRQRIRSQKNSYCLARFNSVFDPAVLACESPVLSADPSTLCVLESCPLRPTATEEATSPDSCKINSFMQVLSGEDPKYALTNSDSSSNANASAAAPK